MASAFGHALVGFTIAKFFDKKEAKLLAALAIGSSILPDVDVLAFSLGIPYEHWLGHRGFTHSILFAILWAFLCSLIFGKQRKIIYFIVIFLSTISHALLDAMTTVGEGVGFFIPFDNTRHFFNYRPIKVSPIGIERFFSEWGMKVIYSELLWIGLPCIILLVLRVILHKKKS